MAPMNLVRASLLVGAVVMQVACSPLAEPPSARVDCGAPGPNGVDCQIQRTGGEGGFEACWDLVISCNNQGQMSGSACHQVPAGANEATQNMPVASFSNQDRCDVPASGKVEGLKINAL